MATLEIGQPAPAFTLRGADKQNYSLGTDGARLTLAVFFKTTCPTCAVAFPYIEKIFQTYRDAGLAVWGISQHDARRAKDFAAKYAATFPLLIDDAWRVSKQYDPDYVPTLFLIAPTGAICERVVSFDKAGLNRLAQTIADRLGVPPVLIAPDNDGVPAFRPG